MSGRPIALRCAVSDEVPPGTIYVLGSDRAIDLAMRGWEKLTDEERDELRGMVGKIEGVESIVNTHGSTNRRHEQQHTADQD